MKYKTKEDASVFTNILLLAGAIIVLFWGGIALIVWGVSIFLDHS